MSRTHDTIKSSYTGTLRSSPSSPTRLCYSPKGGTDLKAFKIFCSSTHSQVLADVLSVVVLAGSMGNATTKLETTHGKFNGLYSDLESEKNVNPR